jgi:hypothetical protein
MMYTTSRREVEGIVQWLQGNHESHWHAQTTLMSQTISNLQDLLRQARATAGTTERPSAESDSFCDKATAINVAMPQLMKMWEAMHNHNREGALEYGQAALELLPVE